MGKTLPLVPINQEHLRYLIATMLVYQQFCQRRTSPSEERQHTLLVLTFLIPKLHQGITPHEGEIPLLLTVDEVSIMKGGLTTMLDQLNRKPASRQIKQEITRLRKLRAMLDQHFSTTQD